MVVTRLIIARPVQILLVTGRRQQRGIQHKANSPHLPQNEDKKYIYGVNILIIFLKKYFCMKLTRSITAKVCSFMWNMTQETSYT